MATEEDIIRIGDIGTAFEIALTEDGSVFSIADALTVKQIKFKKPDGTTVTQDAVFSSDGTDGKLRYVSIVGDIDMRGSWQMQAYVEKASWQGHSEINYFEVFENL
jgi:hypothetical protein